MSLGRVEISRSAKKQLLRVPQHIASKLKSWVEDVENDGLEEVRKIPGYHDEPLARERRRQRSIRLSRSYRAIYTISVDVMGDFVHVEEASKHDY